MGYPIVFLILNVIFIVVLVLPRTHKAPHRWLLFMTVFDVLYVPILFLNFTVFRCNYVEVTNDDLPPHANDSTLKCWNTIHAIMFTFSILFSSTLLWTALKLSDTSDGRFFYFSPRFSSSVYIAKFLLCLSGNILYLQHTAGYLTIYGAVIISISCWQYFLMPAWGRAFWPNTMRTCSLMGVTWAWIWAVVTYGINQSGADGVGSSSFWPFIVYIVGLPVLMFIFGYTTKIYYSRIMTAITRYEILELTTFELFQQNTCKFSQKIAKASICSNAPFLVKYFNIIFDELLQTEREQFPSKFEALRVLMDDVSKVNSHCEPFYRAVTSRIMDLTDREFGKDKIKDEQAYIIFDLLLYIHLLPHLALIKPRISFFLTNTRTRYLALHLLDVSITSVTDVQWGQFLEACNSYYIKSATETEKLKVVSIIDYASLHNCAFIDGSAGDIITELTKDSSSEVRRKAVTCMEHHSRILTSERKYVELSSNALTPTTAMGAATAAGRGEALGEGEALIVD